MNNGVLIFDFVNNKIKSLENLKNYVSYNNQFKIKEILRIESNKESIRSKTKQFNR